MELNKLIALRANADEWYQQCLAEVKNRETAFLNIREMLAENQREQLDAYVSACEELEHSKIYIAYEIGKLKL